MTSKTGPSGILLIDKPRGMTSHDVVAVVRRLAGTRAVGHAGTLDPMAGGLLVLCLGRATRVAQFLSGLDKVYTGTIVLGAISSTYDAEGDIREQDRPVPEEESVVRAAMARQLGPGVQLPPPYSAVKVRGRKLYEYARAGEPVPRKPRNVHIWRFDLIQYDPPQARFEARVGSGTYIRSMAHDLGLALGCGAYLSRLRRTRVGAFGVDQAIPLAELRADPDLLPARLLGVTEALTHLPKVTIQPEAERLVATGRSFTTGHILEFEGILNPGQPVLVIDTQGRALSIVRPEPDEQLTETPVLGATAMIFRPLRVLAPA
ncbi:MAG TPA: tRNA pseudouridine(55) synthase TruB [Candidatus Sumerlaeota bacterium]|nr:tRNA pseudouridine(55) synthase TruB [Candidatus Sumerlaeota bacterium]